MSLSVRFELKCDRCSALGAYAGAGLAPSGWETDRTYGFRLDMCPACVEAVDIIEEEARHATRD